jgi:hypothetical protein
MKKHLLSKSSFLKGKQCIKQLYLYVNKPELKDPVSPMQQAVFKRGSDIGLLAQELFPGGVNVKPDSFSNYDKSLGQTQSMININMDVIYEAAFLFDEVIVFSDIVVNDGGKWKFYEVKSSTGISDTNITDAAIQYYVAGNCGVEISDFSIIYINNEYLRQGKLYLDELFTIESVLDLVNSEKRSIPGEISRFKSLLKEKEEPDVKIGEHCTNPYKCDFYGYCWKHVPENSVFAISNMNLTKKLELFDAGIKTLDDISSDLPLSRNQKLQVEAFKSGEEIIDIKGIQEFLADLSYPLYFMDFETFQSAVPLYNNTKPYQQIPFQYSVHYKEYQTAPLKHFEFLAETDEDPRINFIENLLSDLSGKGDILVYNKVFEITRLREIARDFPKFTDQINSLIPRVKDLMYPFQKRLYYSPKMKGSHSIKNVLPALVPSLSYDELNIAEGSMASIAFEQLIREDDFIRIGEIRKDLLEYCKLDTLAMVKILEVLESLRYKTPQ